MTFSRAAALTILAVGLATPATAQVGRPRFVPPPPPPPWAVPAHPIYGRPAEPRTRPPAPQSRPEDAADPSETQPHVPPVAETVSLSGPRIGVTYLSDGIVEKLRENSIEVAPVVSQFGWQFERQFYSRKGGLTAVTEWVVLLGGLEQSTAIPSLSWLVGLRTPNGTEFGIGPNLTPSGIALAIAGGATLRAGAFNVPLNVAVVPSKSGLRVSFLTGFSLRRW
jgi:hypothetical protein